MLHSLVVGVHAHRPWACCQLSSSLRYRSAPRDQRTQLRATIVGAACTRDLRDDLRVCSLDAHKAQHCFSLLFASLSPHPITSSHSNSSSTSRNVVLARFSGRDDCQPQTSWGPPTRLGGTNDSFESHLLCRPSHQEHNMGRPSFASSSGLGLRQRRWAAATGDVLRRSHTTRSQTIFYLCWLQLNRSRTAVHLRFRGSCNR